MTEKRKIRQVIASGLIAYSKTARKKFVDSGIGPLFCSTNVNGKSLYEDLPRGTLVEIVALVDEPEWKLVRGPAEWKDDPLYLSAAKILRVIPFKPDVVIAKVFSNGEWIGATDKLAVIKNGISLDVSTAQQAVEHSLADAELHGFRWENGLPKMVQWRIDWVGYRGQSWTHVYCILSDAEASFVGWKIKGRRCFLFGMDEDLNWHELDRYEAEAN